MKAVHRVALTGTPGTGKTAIADELAKTGTACDLEIRVIHMNDIVAATPGSVLGRDKGRDSLEIDLDSVDRSIRMLPGDRGATVIVEGHLSHLMNVDHAVVLRCHPRVLKKRLEARGYAPAKVAENVEAEAIDVITIEAVERLGKERVCELVTTDLTPKKAAAIFLELIKGRFKGSRPGSVDWSDYLMGDGCPNIVLCAAKRSPGRGKGGKRGKVMKVRGKSRKRGVAR